MMKSRGAAVIGAFVLIALAIFVRGLLVGDGATGGSDGKDGDKDRAPVVACTPDLVEVCRALAADGKIEPFTTDDGNGDELPATLDLDEASAPPDEVDGWITWNPSPQIANYAAEPSPAVWEQPEVLGSAPQAVLIDGGSVDALAAPCRKDPTWACLADPTSGLSIGVGDPATAEGLGRLAPLARTFATGDNFQTLDTEALHDLIASPPAGQFDAVTQARQMTTQPGALSMTAGAKDPLAAQAATPQGDQRGLRVLTPTPKASLTAVLAPRAGRTGELDALDCEDLSDAVTRALGTAGLTPCEGKADDELAGFLYQVQKKVG